MDNQSVHTASTTDDHETIEEWRVCGRKVPKSEVEFLSQVILIYIVVIASLANIAVGRNPEIFTSLLSICLGAVLPNPQFKRTRLIKSSHNTSDGRHELIPSNT